MTDSPKSIFALGPDSFTSTALGTVAAEWATLELHIDVVIWSLADVHPYKGACITSQLPNVSRRLYALASLVDQRNPSDGLRKRIAQFIDASNKLSRKRNRAVHDPWVHKADAVSDSYRVEVTAEMKFTFRVKSVPTKDLYDLAIEIINHRGILMDMCKDMDAELGTSTCDPSSLVHRLENGDDHT